MKQVLATMSALILCVSFAQAQLTVIEDFDSLTLGNIDMQGLTTEYGYDIEVWNTQANRSERTTNPWSYVVAEGPGNSQCMRMENKHPNGTIDTVYTCMFLGDDNIITAQGTLYMQFKTDGPTDNVMGTNDLWPGYITDVYGTPMEIATDGYQGAGMWGSQATDVRLSSGEDFRIRDGGSYEFYDMGLPANEWCELWIQVDCSTEKSRTYVCVAGETPQLVPSVDATGWCEWRDGNTNTRISNIKWHDGSTTVANNTWIDNIAINTSQLVTTSLWEDVPEPHPGDANSDGTVNLDDFIILKQHYGQDPAVWAEGNFNDDTAVNLDDFIILKQNYGWTEAE